MNRFMIFNSNEGQDEGRESDKLLYHWTKDAVNNKVSLVEQIDDICLCDASVNASTRLNTNVADPFSGEYNPSQDTIGRTSTTPSSSSLRPNANGRSLVLNFDSTVILVVEVEPDQAIWMAMHVSTKSTSDQNDTPQSSPTNHQSIDLNRIPIDAVERIINNIYARFCLLNGSFLMIMKEIEKNHSGDEQETDKEKKTSLRNNLRSTCDKYFDAVLREIHLSSLLANITSLYNYISYLNLNPITLMKVNSFINHLISINPSHIRHSITIFNDKLIWSSLNMFDTRLVYNYLVSVLIRDALQEELRKEIDKVRKITENTPIYLTDDADNCSSTDKERNLSKLYLTVFRSSNNMTVGLLLDEPDMFDLIRRCESVLTSDSRFGVIPLASLAQSVGQSFLKSNTNRDRSKHMCLNRLHYSVYGMETQSKERFRLIKSLVKLNSDLDEIKVQSGYQVDEFIGKTSNDCWLTMTNSKYRTVYSIDEGRDFETVYGQVSLAYRSNILQWR